MEIYGFNCLCVREAVWFNKVQIDDGFSFVKKKGPDGITVLNQSGEKPAARSYNGEFSDPPSR